MASDIPAGLWQAADLRGGEGREGRGGEGDGRGGEGRRNWLTHSSEGRIQ